MARENATKMTHEINPTTFSVVWNKLDYITEQIGQKILYSTQSFVTANVRDLGQTLLNSKGKIVLAATFLPIHTMVAEEAIKGLQSYFENDYQPGDFIIANDPYIVAGGHLPDWNFIRPIFYNSELLGFFQAKTHVSDTGGFLPGGYGPGAYDIIAEGLNIPPLKIIKQGILQKDLWNFLLRNVRNPAEVDMDTQLINGCMVLAEEQVVALCDKYGVNTIKACMDEIVAAGERAMRSEIEKIPDGTYYGEAATDWDGKTDKPIWVRVNVTVKADEITFDFSASDPQATFVNCPKGVTITDAMLSLFYICDSGVPKNGGTMEPVHIIAPEGSVVNPRYPATVGASQISVGTQIVEACMLALGKAVPERAMAGWAKHLCPINIGLDPLTIDPRTGHIRHYFSETFASDAGSGAVKGFDGWQGIAMQAAAGNFMRPNIEFFESVVPYVVTKYEVLTDWEGPGEFRGSPGSYVEFVAHTTPGAPSFLMTGNSDGMAFAPPGVEGGGSAPLAEMYIESTDDQRRVLRTMANMPIFPGEKCVTKTSGGGGWGNPLHRDVHKVRDDVMDGLVSVERARNVYGVVIDPVTFEVQYTETDKLRKELKSKQS